LFVLMMLNIKIAQLKHERLNYVALVATLGIILTCELFLIFQLEFNPLFSVSKESVKFLSDLIILNTSFSNELNVVLEFNNMLSVGQILFVDFSLYFIIVGYILLLAMIAAITSTLNKKFNAKSQFIYAQVLRSFNESITQL
jgi:NADH-quinone oxidoreductase subunit J